MDQAIVSPKQTVSFRWNAELVNKLKAIAKEHNRSLSNLTETLISNILSDREVEKDIPNQATLDAINEAKSGQELETLHMDHFKDFVKSL